MFSYIIHNNRIRNEELRHDAQTDGLTGVLNKRTTEHSSNEILEQRPHEKGTFIILDVDKFKEVNDHYGHAVGDIVLSTLGQTLRNYFREMISLEESVEMSLSFTCANRTAEMDIFFSKSRIVLYNDDISQECRHNIIYTKHIMHE